MWRLCRRTASLQLVVIHHEDAQTEGRSGLGVAGHELFLVMIQVKIEWITGVGIDDHHVGVNHDQLSELQPVTAVGHVVARRYLLPFVRLLLRLGISEDLNNVVGFKTYAVDAAGDSRKRKN